MDIGYIVKGKLLGEDWKSSIFDDAQECDDFYCLLQKNSDYADLKLYNAYVHYEEF